MADTVTRPPTIYVAASFLNQQHARQFAELLGANGAVVCARWLFEREDHPELASLGQEDRKRLAAERCLADLEQADAIVLVNPPKDVGTYATGGRHFELGYAWARGKVCAIYGTREHVFHWNERLIHVPWDPLAHFTNAAALVEEIHRRSWRPVPLPVKGDA